MSHDNSITQDEVIVKVIKTRWDESSDDGEDEDNEDSSSRTATHERNRLPSKVDQLLDSTDITNLSFLHRKKDEFVIPVKETTTSSSDLSSDQRNTAIQARDRTNHSIHISSHIPHQNQVFPGSSSDRIGLHTQKIPQSSAAVASSNTNKKDTAKVSSSIVLKLFSQ